MAYNKVSNKAQNRDIKYISKDYSTFKNQLIEFAKDKGLLSSESNRSELIGRFNDLIDTQTNKKDRNKLKKALKDARKIEDLKVTLIRF